MLVSLLKKVDGAAKSIEVFFATLENFRVVNAKSFKRLYKRAAKIHASYIIALKKVEAVNEEMQKLELARVEA